MLYDDLMKGRRHWYEHEFEHEYKYKYESIYVFMLIETEIY